MFELVERTVGTAELELLEVQRVQLQHRYPRTAIHLRSAAPFPKPLVQPEKRVLAEQGQAEHSEQELVLMPELAPELVLMPMLVPKLASRSVLARERSAAPEKLFGESQQLEAEVLAAHKLLTQRHSDSQRPDSSKQEKQIPLVP